MTTATGRRRPGRIVLPWSGAGESTAPHTLPRVAPWALLSSAAVPIVLAAAWLVADTVQPASYSPMRQTVSVLSGDAASQRWIVTIALYAVGAGYLVTALGMRDLAAAARNGLLVAGISAIGVAAFPVPVHGTSRPHAVFVVVGAVAIAAWPALAARQASVRAAVGARLSAVAIVVSAALFLWTAVEVRGGSLLGLAERTSSGLQVAWPFVVALTVRRVRAPDSRDGDGGDRSRAAQLAG